jgi:phenylacetate-CoA ligase
MDLSYLYPKGQCGCGSWLRKMGPFTGRGDNMIKLRGVNVWPEGIGSIACDVPGTLPDYFVIARRDGARDEMIISVVSDRDPSHFDSIKDEIERRLKAQIGVVISAEVVPPGSIDHLTELHTSPKPKRFRDDRTVNR